MLTRKRRTVFLVSAILMMGAAIALAAAAFTEHWTAATSPSFTFLPGGGTIASNVADTGALDGRVVRLTAPAGLAAGPPTGPNIRSNVLYDYGTYEARLKTADCSSQPNTSLISGFFTYFNDGTDQNGNGIADNSEIDFEWLCAEPNVIWISMWTDYQDSPEAFRRVYRIVDLASGTIRETCYSTTWSCTQPLTGSATEAQPATIPALPGYNSATAYYTYGFTWLADRLTWYVVHPTSGQRLILWDYRGPAARFTRRPAYFYLNLWHSAAWAPPGMPGALQPPNSPRHLLVDIARYSPPGATPTATAAPRSTATATPRPRATAPGGNLALGRPAASSSNETAALTPSLAVDGSLTTRWASAYTDPQWIRVDLGSPVAVSRVVLRWEAAYGRAYQIQTSNDGASWTTVYSTAAGDGGVDDLAVSGSGRYVRMYGTQRATPWGYSLWELEVHGTSGGSTPTATARPRATPTATPAATNLIANGEFDSSTASWTLGNWGGAASGLSVVTTAALSGGNAGKVTITNGGTLPFHVQLRQPLPITAGRTYTISFLAKADAPRTMNVVVQQLNDPWTTYWTSPAVSLTTSAQAYSYTFTAGTTDATTLLELYLGTSATAVYVDRIVVSAP
jgi:hypothetical protein